MKKTYKISTSLFILVLSLISLILYIQLESSFTYNSPEIAISRILLISTLNCFFYSVIFFGRLTHFKKIFEGLMIFIVFTWLLVYVFGFFSVSWEFWDFWEIITYISFSMIAPGLIGYVSYYTRRITGNLEEARIFSKYHIHEGFAGIIFIFTALLLLYFHSLVVFLNEPYYRRLSFIIVGMEIFSFIFLFLGSFFCFRDWRDIIQIKLVEVRIINDNKKGKTSVFKQITKENLDFFKIPKIMIYPFGLIIITLSINMIIYNTDFIPPYFYHLDETEIIMLGYISCFIAGAITGLDWLRLFKIFYPEIYKEIEQAINSIID